MAKKWGGQATPPPMARSLIKLYNKERKKLYSNVELHKITDKRFSKSKKPLLSN